MEPNTLVDYLKSEILVAKNCLVKTKKKNYINIIKQIITKDIYPNLYELL